MLAAQTPAITSIQSGYGSPTNGAAITAGTQPPNDFTDLNLYINGSFNTNSEGVYNVVTWNENNTSTVLLVIASSANQLVANVPVSLYQTAGTATIQVIETSTDCYPPSNTCPGPTATATYTVNPPLANVGSSLPTGVVGTSYSQNFFSGGTAPFTVQFNAGAAPPGVTATASTGNPLSGTPSQAGTFPVTPTVTDAWGNTITLNESVTFISQLVITTHSLPTGVAGQSYTATVSAANGTPPYIWSASLPTGLSIDSSTGVISGSTAAGTYTVTVTATDSGGVNQQTTQASYTLLILPALTITSGAPPSGVAARAYSFTATATGGVTPYTWSATGLPSNLTINSSTGTISGTPGTAGSYPITVTVTDSGGTNRQTTSAQYTLVINGDLTITSGAPPAGVAGHAYGFTATASGGVTPYTWSASGLPSNLTINSSTGAISGTPVTAGSYPITLTVTDSGGASQQTASAQYTLVIIPSLTITSGAPPAGVAGHAYSFTATASGGVTPYTWSASGLPSNLTINSSTGTISGTPGAAGSYPITVTVTDSGGANQQTASSPYTLVISGGLTITSGAPPAGVAGHAYSFTATASGGVTPYTWSASGLPSNLTINSSTGTISGTPATAGSYPITVTVTDSGGANQQTASSPYTLVIIPGLTITSGAPPAGAAGKAYSFTATAGGGVTPYTWSASGLPTNLTINSSTGTISGTPATAGSYPITVTVTDSGGANQQTASSPYTLVINTGLAITSGAPPAGAAGKAYSFTATASGGVTPYTWSASGLPTNLTINSSTGTISGTPATAGSYPITVTVTDSGGANQQTASSPYTLVINAGLTITSGAPTTGAAGKPYTFTATASGGVTPYTWSASGLPSNLTINSSTGTISGTPATAGSYPITVTVTDSGVGGAQQTASAQYTLVINAGLTITSGAPPAGVAAKAYTFTATASGGVTPYTWSATGLPSNLTISSSTGTISGTPATAGSYPITVTVTDSGGANQQTASAQYTLVISSGLTITSGAPPAGVAAKAYTFTATASGGVTPYTWSATGLPSNLTISSSTGTISGTPATAGSYPITVTVTDSGGANQQTASAQYTLVITAGLTITSGAPPAGVAAKAYTFTATASGGVTPYTWSATGLPSNLTISSSTGTISGTPATAGSYPITVTVTDSGGANQQTTSAQYTLVISSGLTITSGAPPAGVATKAYTFTATASGGVTPYTWSATGLPSNLTINSSTGTISGTPATAGSYPITVTVTDSGVGAAQQTASAQYTLVITTGLTITTSALPAGVVQQAYSATVAASGGTTPYTWSATGLPANLTISSSTGIISGTPSVSGTFPVTVTVMDAGVGGQHIGQQTTQAMFSLVINSGLTITTSALPAGAAQQAYSATMTASGGTTPYTWSATGLPANLTINNSTGVISGTPAAAGSYPVTVTVTDSGAGQAQQTTQARYTLVVAPALSITTASLPAGAQQQPYNTTVAATGGTPAYTWSATGLPANLTINSSTGAITGTPTLPGTFSVTVTVTDSGTGPGQQTKQATFSLVINSNLTITTSALPVGRIQVAYSATAAASGGVPPYTWSATGLPASLTINASTGAITGTPSVSGTFPVVVTVTDSTSFSTKTTLQLQIAAILTVTTAGLPSGQVSQQYAGFVNASGGVPPYTWTATNLPGGLTLSSTGAITGAPLGSGTTQVTFHVTDSGTPTPQTAQATLSLTINPTPPATLQISTPSLGNGVTGQIYVGSIAATGGAGDYSFTLVGGSLPPGVSLATSGQIYGTPTTPGTYNFTVQVADNSNTATHTYSIQITPGALGVTGSVPTSVSVNSPISVTFGGTGGVSPYKLTLTGTAPTGTSFSGTTLSGTATTAGTYTFTINLSDSQTPAGTASKTFTITVTPGPLTVTANLPPAQAGVPYSAQLTATGGTGGYTFSGTAGDGLTVSSSGLVSGTPTTSGTVSISVTVTDSSGAKSSGTFPLTITPPPLTVTTTTLPAGALNADYGGAVAASGGTMPYVFSASGLPAGLSINSATGAITGTPTAVGTFTVTVTVTDANKVTVSGGVSLTINPAPLKITTTGISPAVLGQSFSVGFGATGGTTPYTWTATGLPSGVTISSTGTISGTPTALGSFPVTVTVTDANQLTASQTVTLTVSLPAAPTITFTGLPATGTSGSQVNSPVTFSNTYPVDVTINLTLTFTPINGPDDPNIQFASGGRTTSVTVKAGSTVSLSNIGVQTGTVAGTITITAQLLASGTDITPVPAPVRTIVIPPSAPSLTTISETSSGTAFTITVVGFDPTRSITQATFTFTPAAGSTLQTTTFTVPATSLFTTWYQGSGSAQYGSQFSFSETFNVSGSLSGIGSVSVTLTNPTGTSNSLSVQVH